ncbi:Hypothetical_protein [Hexamita inflata]|uniref:Hypothetical_protein n=1 Tax=Hexamita inflata TaxID=28002 RepID=A0AA86PIC2_9EUKA|nr:Hypothetical protein HINF_LOCUS26698 [Hexamita inflata]
MKWKWKIISKITVVLEQHQYIIQCWARLTHLIPFFKKQKGIHYLYFENESDCNYLNYNSNQAKYQYFILSSRLRLKKKSSIVFVIKKYLKSFRLTQLKMNTEVLCRSSACATSYKLHIASVYQSLDPLILFSIRLNYHIFSRQNLSQISFVDQNVEITQGHLKQVIQLVQIGTIFYEFIRWTQK